MKKTILNKSQLEAIDFFETYDYLVIEAARQTGKTTVLQAIIERNEDKRIGIITCNYKMYYNNYKQFNYKNIECINFPKESIISKNFDMIIGDEIFLEPFSFNNGNKKIKTACALTPIYIVKNLSIPKDAIKHAKKIKKMLSKDDFEIEYGRFLNSK